MLTILISIILFSVITLWLSWDCDYKEDRISNCIDMLIPAIIVGTIIAFSLNFEEKDVKSIRYIETLSDGNNLDGSFFLGCGYINNVMKYTYYYDAGDSTYVLEQIDCDKVQIKYTTSKPYIENIDSEFVNHSDYLWGIPSKPSRKIIYIPKGSIIKNYTLDAK